MTATMFVLLIAGLLALVLLLVLRPLWRQALPDADRLELNKTLYRERAAEIELLFASGSIDSAEKMRRETENARRLLADAETSDGGLRAAMGRTPLALVLIVALPAVAALLYLQLGSYAKVRAWQQLETQDVGAGNRDMNDMLLLLRSRLHDDPEDVEGWYLLGRSYLSMQRGQEALQAFDQARRQAPNEPDYLVAYAQTLRLVEQDSALPEVDRLLTQALQLDPMHEGARLLNAYRDMERGRYEQAIATFEALKRSRANDSESATMLDKVIADAKAASAAAGQAPFANMAVSAPVAAPVGSPAGTQAAAANPPSTAANKPGAVQQMTVQVSLAPALVGRPLAEKARVFVFARSENGPGLPVAVAVLPASQLPATVTLSDANAMNPAVKLSDQQRVKLVARVSMAGSVEPVAGDLQGQLAAFDWRQQPQQKLIIDSVL
ncbi:c-type cytochrome biogenesis protein CcmI [Permianibacter sp. IMCC34836]|uniref:c-type cytochrome biogenesis protein CcmI n=1 Tax=Permianibacter fluminis TaxID=2738515 RepID=UPI001552547A|nr:c-type cytochrome biogenesis protein CcmI [Permianibacter fluminis]NQD38212.1 c-type cytochrome biogenesis protein CcmI [Permianibacter fluminis]